MTMKTTSNPRLLVVIASHGTRNDRYLIQVVKEYQSMSFDTDILVLSNIPKNLAPGVEVIVVDMRGKDPWSLPFSHERIFADRLNDYDLFLYSEDDILIREENLRAFQEVSAVLPEEELPGFFRYEGTPEVKLNYPDVHGPFIGTLGPFVCAVPTRWPSSPTNMLVAML